MWLNSIEFPDWITGEDTREAVAERGRVTNHQRKLGPPAGNGPIASAD
jgi:hypothetical protein